MKIRLDEQIITLGDYRIVRVDDYNLELQDADGELIGYYSFMCHAVKQAFKLTMNDVRELGVYDDILGDKQMIEETSEEIHNSVPLDSIYDFNSVAKEKLLR